MSKEHAYAYESGYQDGLRAAESDNAKLRELVRALDWCTENADVRDKCDRCPLEQSDACEPECEVMMREMGVESKE